MRKIFLFYIFLTIATKTAAQDRIIIAQKDTLLAKVLSISNQQVSYYLEADKDKKTSELPFSSLHKIIWRNGMEYVINKELDDKLKKNLPAKSLEKPQAKTSTNAQPRASVSQDISNVEQKVKNAPQLRIRQWIFWQTYVVNNTRVSSDELARTLYQYDLTNYNKYTNGEGIQYRGRKIGRIALATFAGGGLLYAAPALGVLVQLGSIGVGISGNIKSMKGLVIKRQAVADYEYKRVNYLLKSKFSNQ